MTQFSVARIRAALMFAAVVSFVVSGCSNGENGSGGGGGGRSKFLSMGTAPVGGAFPVVGGAIAEVLNAHKGDNGWKVQAKGTKGSQENIRKLEQGELEMALSNAAITYFAVRGESGWEKAYDVRSIMTLAPNVGMFITRSDSGIRSIADLKGKRVIVGPSGAGFEMFVRPLVEEHGLKWDEFTQVNATQSGAVDLLGDGSADAAFLGGAVPTGSITQATSTFDVFFVPYDEQVRQRLIEKYPFFHDATVPGGTYKGLDEDFPTLNVGSMHLITSAGQDEELVYQLTKTIWENREEVAAKHPAGKSINPKNAIRNTGTEFHPGAIRFYKEAGIWPSDAADATNSAETPSDSASPAESEAAGGDDADAASPTTDVSPSEGN
ncbi:MAG: TAXI family TRAP transporter solute-binding subunit [Planctomycetales bacterium]|nr:TAXI family TRAP transporter solute-binding subunit [Planctomycetales bacterium]MCA9225232.1 TAXI family TRAP transporter solute-binding subunit [Planctomycetales bacterium]